MVANHSRARKTHDFADFLPFVRFVAMDAAGRAKCLRLHERTSFHPLANIICKAFAVSAETFWIFERERIFVLSPAVKLNHKKHRPPFLLTLFFDCHFHAGEAAQAQPSPRISKKLSHSFFPASGGAPYPPSRPLRWSLPPLRAQTPPAMFASQTRLQRLLFHLP